MEAIVKSQETREGVKFRIYKSKLKKFVYHTIKFQNYFYVKTSDFSIYQHDFMRRFKNAIATIEEVSFYTKITFANNFLRQQMRDFFEDKELPTYEADIKANKRFLLSRPKIDLQNENVPYVFFDIETDDRGNLVKDDRGRAIAKTPILSFAAVDQNGNETFFYNKAREKENPDEHILEGEKQLLIEIIEYFSKHVGLISGWYSEKFDSPYIKQRCEVHNIDYSVTDFINHLDYRELYTKYDKKSLPSYSLNSVAGAELGEQKIEQKKGGGAIYNAWISDFEHLKEYNLEDCRLIYRMNIKLSFIEVSQIRADLAHCHIRDTFQNSVSGDYWLMRECREQGIIMPSAPNKRQYEQRKALGQIGGGYTTCFEPGLHKCVRVFDFKSEYPSMIMTFNICPTTFQREMSHEEYLRVKDRFDYDKYIITPDDTNEDQGYTVHHPHRVYLRKEGIVPKVVRGMVEERDKIKYEMPAYEKSNPERYRRLYLHQYALKTDANSVYGFLSFPLSRWYMKPVGDSVTTCARHLLKLCGDEVPKWGARVIGGDTDSQFVVIGEDVSLEYINKKYAELFDNFAKQWRLDKHYIEFEYEKEFRPMIFVKKKNYAIKEFKPISAKFLDEVPLEEREQIGDFWYYKKGKNKIVGLEAIKADTNPLAARLQKKYLYEQLDGGCNEEEWRLSVKELYTNVFGQKIPAQDLQLVKALTKMPSEYEGYTIDKKTGKPKVKRDGTLQKKTVPAHVKLAQRMLDQGIDLNVGDKIPFIVIKDKPILAISPEEYEAGKGKFLHKDKKKGEIEIDWNGEYEPSYYWTRIIKPLAKIMYVINKNVPDYLIEGMKATEKKKILSLVDNEEDGD